MREIVSRQWRHKDGVARVEMDAAQHLQLTCSGCQVEEYQPNMAQALFKLRAHVGEDAEEIPD